MHLLPIPDPDDWEQEIADEAATEYDATITVSTAGTPGTYSTGTDSVTGGTAGTTLISARPGRAQQMRLPLTSADSGEWGPQRRYLIQFIHQNGDPAIPKGAVAKVTGGRDATLWGYTFHVVHGTNSTHRAVRTLHTIAEAAGG